MKREHLITALKLVLVAALMGFVFSTVNWQDTLITQTPTGEETEVTGDIIGRWDTPQIEFEPTGGERMTVSPGEQEDGSALVISPGFGTYVVQLNWLLFAAGALCYALTVIFAGSRWWWLLRVNQLDVTWREALRFTWIGLFFNNVVPGQTGGDVVKALYIVKHCHGARMPALISVLVDRVLGLGSLALFGGLVVLFALDKPGFDVLATGIWGVLGGVAVLGIVAFSKRVRRLIRLDDLLNKLPAGLSGVLKRIDQAIYFYRGHKGGIFGWMVAGMANHALSVTSVMLIGMALRIQMPAYEYFALVPVINIASAVPLGPNGWGVGEALYRLLFGTYGAPYLAEVPQETAKLIMGTRGVALSVVFRIHMTLWSLLGGLMVLLDKNRVTRHDVEEEVALEAEEAEEAKHEHEHHGDSESSGESPIRP